MNKLIDAFRVVVEPLRFMIAKNSRRIEELAQTPIEDILPSTVPVMPSAPTASDSGKIPMVQEDGSWGLGEVPGGSGGGSAGGIKDFIIDILNDENVGDEVISINCDFAELWGIAHGRDTNSALKVYIRRADIFEDGVVDIAWYGVERVTASTFERTPGVEESAEHAVLVIYDDGSALAIWPDNTVERYEF